MSFSLGLARSVMAGLLLALPSATVFAQAPVERIGNPIRDAAGRIEHIVDLRRDALYEFPDHVPDAVRARFASRHSAAVVNFALSLERRYGFATEEIVSWVGLAVIAYLTPQQVEQLSRHPHVARITESGPWVFSSSPPWNDTVVGTETYSWGRNAVGGAVSTGTSPDIYVVDAGVGNHADIGISRRLIAGNPLTRANQVGCYAHATHVAGIIAARAGTEGAAGVLAGANVVSVSLSYENWGSSTDPGVEDQNAPNRLYGVCSAPAIGDGMIAAALDVVRADRASFPNTAAVLNLSVNGSIFDVSGAHAQMAATILEKMGDLATPNPGTAYAGVFIAQSAGNQHADACGRAYSAAVGAGRSSLPNDGIMVVGGVDRNGNMVVPTGAGPGFDNDLAGDEPGSNYGNCVDIWAPSTRILSGWGPTQPLSRLDWTTWQDSIVTYNNTTLLSGTSMAAPHVAGIAALVVQRNPSLRSTDIEAEIRSTALQLNALDTHCAPAPCAVRFVQNPFDVRLARKRVVVQILQSLLDE